MTLDYLDKYNVVDYQTLRSMGMSHDVIADAVDCCMLKLTRGNYSIVSACSKRKHQSASVLITDEDWTEYFRTTTPRDRANDFRFREHLARLSIVHYRHFRSDDVLSGVSAALVHDLPLFSQDLLPITVVHPSACSASVEIIRRRRRFSADDLCIVHGLRCFTHVKTGLDLIAELSPADGMAALEGGLRAQVERETGNRTLGMKDPRRMHSIGREIVERDFVPAAHRLSRGKVRALSILSVISPLSENYAESRTSFALHQLGLHDFTQQWNVGLDGSILARLDFLHVPTKTVLAFDGDQKYADAGAARLKHEGRQQNELMNMGFRIVHMNFSDVLNLKRFGTKLFGQAPQLLQYRRNPTLR
ncbi:hypothetical protein [Brevibacterium atlanticum]|uniref:hypothetical protein n=1 Tax=Brevibacterium atlanticum TaxID=2697563 RepID=UPI001420C0CB|nr:hypothetical protein [Brevibacterium atlanticum]